MKVIFDLDQDFFFLPRVLDANTGEDSIENKIWRYKNQEQVIDAKKIVDKYNIKRKNYTIFRNHQQVFYYIKNNYGKIDKLLHFDAHSDIEDSNSNFLSIGNWIQYLINEDICNDIDWITPDFNYLGKFINSIGKQTIMKTNKGVEYKLYVSDINSHKWEQHIDEVLITVSPEFCPNNGLINEIINFMY